MKCSLALINHMATKKQIIRTLSNQIESDYLLGGKWLPMDSSKKKQSQPQDYTQGKQLTKEAKACDTEKQGRLAEVAQAISQCRQCDLCKSRLNTVPGSGNTSARIMFVGEAPGQSEDEQALPFVGRAGQLLTNIINAMGLDRQDVFIGNILKCRPPDNRDPQAPEIDACIGFLKQQLEIIDPDIIVALGAHAARTLLNMDLPIGQLRGRVLEYRPDPMAKPIKLIATYHPAYLLRNYTPEARQRVWEDMQKVLQELGLPVPKIKKT
jgi:uracil-DNA glycosylase